jgi:hypothetical protein
VNCRAKESDVPGFASIPLVHLRDLVTALAGEICRFQWGVVDDAFSKGNWAIEPHVRNDTSGKGQEDGGFAEHCDVGLCVVVVFGL